MLIYASMLVFFCLPGALLMVFIPLPNNNDPNLPSNFIAIIRVGAVLIYAMFAALGGFWLYFFNGRNVKAQFVGQQPLATSASPELFAGAPYAGHRPSSRARPLSITIIGWFLLVGSALTPLCILFNKILFSGVQIPLFLFGFIVSGRGAYAILVMWMAIQLVAAVGLLKLKRWGLVRDHRIAVPGDSKLYADGRHSSESSKISATHGNNVRFRNRANATASSAATCISNVDRSCNFVAYRRLNFVVPGHTETGFLLRGSGSIATVSFA
jgi:hypothetical protein